MYYICIDVDYEWMDDGILYGNKNRSGESANNLLRKISHTSGVDVFI
jgi:hypothetical protein